MLFADPSKGGRVALGDGAVVAIVTGLEPGRRYGVSVNRGASCRLEVAPSSDASAPAANAGGFIRVSATECGAP